MGSVVCRWEEPKSITGGHDPTESGRGPSKVQTPGVEAAMDFVKGRKVPGVSLAPTSVKEEMQKELERRRKLREQRAAEAEALAAVAAAAAVEGARAAAATGGTVPAVLSSDVGAAPGSPTSAPTTQQEALAPEPSAVSSPMRQHLQQQLEQRFGSPDRMGSGSRVMAPTASFLRRSMSAFAADPDAMRPLSPSYSWVQRRAPSVTFGPAPPRDSSSSRGRGHRFSRDPGPGAYDPDPVSVSYQTRPPAAVFLQAPRYPSPPASSLPSAEALAMWRSVNVGEALDRLKRRVPAAFLNTAGERPAAVVIEEEVEGAEGQEGVVPQVSVPWDCAHCRTFKAHLHWCYGELHITMKPLPLPLIEFSGSMHDGQFVHINTQ